MLLDCTMPEVDGPAAAEVILSRLPQTRIILHSGGASEQNRAQAAALGLTILDKSLLRDTTQLIATMAAEMRPTLEPLVLRAIADLEPTLRRPSMPTAPSRPTTGMRHRSLASRYPPSRSRSDPA